MTPEEYIKSHPEDTEYAQAYSAKMSHAAPAQGVDPHSPGQAPIPMGPPAPPPLPTEWHPEQSGKGLMGTLGDLASSLPDTIPGVGALGGTHMWAEPSLAEFRRATGNRAAKPDSPEFRQYAEAKWAEALQAAQQAGRGIVRTDKIQPEDAVTSIAKGAAQAMNAIPETGGAAALGALDVGTLGLGTRVLPAAAEKFGLVPKGTTDRITDTMEEHPIASLAGGMGGFLGIPGLIAKGAAKLGLGAAGSGAAVGAGANVGKQLSEAAANELQDKPAALDASDLLTGALGGAAVGGALGAVGSGLAGTQKTLRSELYNPEVAGDLRTFEAGGGKLTKRGILPGAKRMTLPDTVQSNFDEALAGGPTGARFPSDVAAGRAAPGITKNIVSRANALEDEWQGFLDAYKASPEGKTPLPPKNVADTLLKIIDTRTYPGTEAKIPFASRSEFKQALNDAFEVTTPAPSPKAPPGVHGEIRTVAEARNMGFAVQGPDTYKVLLIPRKLDATRFEAMMGDLSTLAKEGASAVPPETYRQLVAAARSDRDAYPWPKEFGPEPTATTEDGVATKGFSAAHTKIHQKLSELEGQMKGAGIPKRRDVRGSDVLPDVEKSVRSYGREGQEPLTKALLDLAGSDPALQARLKEIPATGAAEALMQKGRYFKSGTPMTSGNVNAARLRIDPILGALGDILPKAIAPATGGRVADEKFKSLIRDLYGH